MIDWSALFGFSVAPLEILVRGSAIYWFLFLIFRLVLRREIGALGIADVLVVVLIADASQNAMAGEYRSISEGLLLISTIVLWNVLVDYAAYRSTRLARLLEPAPLVLIHHGRVQHANLRREFLSTAELLGKLREKGIDDVARVKRAVMESNGDVSVIAFAQAPVAPQTKPGTRPV